MFCVIHTSIIIKIEFGISRFKMRFICFIFLFTILEIERLIVYYIFYTISFKISCLFKLESLSSPSSKSEILDLLIFSLSKNDMFN